MLDFTRELSKAYYCTPFDVMEQDTERVILMINYYIEKGKNKPVAKQEKSVSKNQRIKVNDKTASGGWF